MKDYSVLEELVPKTEELHRAIFDKGYEQGYKDGVESMAGKKAYKKGLEDAWECARRLAFCNGDGELEVDAILDILDEHSFYAILRDNSASEAIAKIKQYEEKQKQTDNGIKIGDEVIDLITKHKGVVVGFYKTGALSVLYNEYGVPQRTDMNSGFYEKTGRHYDGIEEILKAMRGEE